MSISNYLIIFLFLIVAILIIFAGHVFIYYSIVNFFKITNPQIKSIISYSLIFLGISFILASLLAHWSEILPVKIYYFLATTWLGIFIYWLMAFAVVKLLNLIFIKLHYNFNLRTAGLMAISVALIYVGYGIWNAYHPRLKNITVKINNLPTAWAGKTAVQISDLHLGIILGQNFLKKTVDQVNSVNPDIVFITGDLLDGMESRLDFGIQYLDQLKAPFGVYFITGNHETYFGTAKTYSILQKTKVRILNDELININGLQIIGISYPDRGAKKNLAEIIKKLNNFNPTESSILLYHDPVQVSQVKETGINLQLAGHTHCGQLFPFNFITQLVYHGYDYGLHQMSNYSIYTTCGTGVWGPTLRTGSQPEIAVIKLIK